MLDLLLQRRRELLYTVQEPPEEAVHPDYVRFLIKTTSNNTSINYLYDRSNAALASVSYIRGGVTYSGSNASTMSIPTAGTHEVFVKVGSGNRINSGMGSYAVYCRLNYTGTLHASYLYQGGGSIKMLDIPTTTLNQSHSNFLNSLGTSTVKLVRVPKGTLDYYKEHVQTKRWASKIVETKKFNNYLEVFNSL